MDHIYMTVMNSSQMALKQSQVHYLHLRTSQHEGCPVDAMAAGFELGELRA